MASFGSVSFTVDRGGFSEQREARAAIQEIPGGDEFTLDLAGRQPHKLSVKAVFLNETAWGAMNAAIGTVGSLAIETLTTHNAVLLSANREAPALDGQVTANLDFVITDD